MIKRNLVILLVLAIVLGNSIATRRPLLCPKPSLVASFDASQYAGTWYEIYRDKKTTFERGTSCVTATYAVVAPNEISVLNKDTTRKGT